jgi:hypothetical protein
MNGSAPKIKAVIRISLMAMHPNPALPEIGGQD